MQKIKEIPQEDLTNFVGRFLGGASFAEGFYVEKDNLITTYLKVDFDGLIEGEQMLFLSRELNLFRGDLCYYIDTNKTAISEYGFKINYKNAYFVVNKIETTCDQERVRFEIRYSKYPNLIETATDHDSPKDLQDIISRLINNRAY